jgi:vitamin B12 transporter
MKKEKKVWAITLIVFWLWAPNQLKAQTDSLKTLQLNEVIVTATKFPKSSRETGKVVDVIDEYTLRQSAGKDISQLLSEQTGLIINGANSNAGKDKSVYLRGAKNEYTLILIDGVPITDPSGISGGAYDLRMLSLDQVERIEILKGSQSTLYGSDAIAGVINIITKKKFDKKIHAAGGVSYGSFNTLRGNAGIQGGGNKLNYQASYSVMDTDGISEAKQTGNATFDKDGASQQALHTSVNFKANESFSIRPFIRYSTFKGAYDAGAFTDDVLNKYDAAMLSTGLQSDYKLKKGSVIFQYSFDESTRRYDGTYGPIEYNGKFNHLELFSNYQLSKQIQIMAGLATQQFKMMDATASEKDPAVRIFSPFVSLLGNFNKFSLEGGIRYNHHTKFGDATTFSINPSCLIHQLKLFANFSSGFKAPTLYQLFGLYGANPNLKPERSLSNEIGTSWISANNKFDLRVVAFQRNVNDVIVYTFPININLDNQRDKGIEIDMALKATGKITVKGFYAYTDGRVSTQQNGKDSTYYNLFRRPKHSVGILTSVALNNHIFFSVNSRYIGNRTDLFFDMETFTNQYAVLKGYCLVDFYAEYKNQNPNMIFFLDAKNILNQNYMESYGYNSLPFNINTGLRFTLLN